MQRKVRIFLLHDPVATYVVEMYIIHANTLYIQIDHLGLEFEWVKSTSLFKEIKDSIRNPIIMIGSTLAKIVCKYLRYTTY